MLLSKTVIPIAHMVKILVLCVALAPLDEFSEFPFGKFFSATDHFEMSASGAISTGHFPRGNLRRSQ